MQAVLNSGRQKNVAKDRCTVHTKIKTHCIKKQTDTQTDRTDK
jgi:hypothetical protein